MNRCPLCGEETRDDRGAKVCDTCGLVTVDARHPNAHPLLTEAVRRNPWPYFRPVAATIEYQRMIRRN